MVCVIAKVVQIQYKSTTISHYVVILTMHLQNSTVT